MNRKRFETNIDFADAEDLNFQMSDDCKLSIVIKLWDESPAKLVFSNILRFSYSRGDIISGFYEVNNSPFLDEALSQYFIKVPLNHSFKLYQLEDVSGNLFIEVVAEHVIVVVGAGPA